MKKGFTLVEIIVACAVIISIIALSVKFTQRFLCNKQTVNTSVTVNSDWFPKTHTYNEYPREVVDTDCVVHMVSSRYLDIIHNGLFFKDVEGHELMIVVDERGIGSVVHVKPCKRCAEVERLKPTRFNVGTPINR